MKSRITQRVKIMPLVRRKRRVYNEESVGNWQDFRLFAPILEQNGKLGGILEALKKIRRARKDMGNEENVET